MKKLLFLLTMILCVSCGDFGYVDYTYYPIYHYEMRPIAPPPHIIHMPPPHIGHPMTPRR